MKSLLPVTFSKYVVEPERIRLHSACDKTFICFAEIEEFLTKVYVCSTHIFEKKHKLYFYTKLLFRFHENVHVHKCNVLTKAGNKTCRGQSPEQTLC